MQPNKRPWLKFLLSTLAAGALFAALYLPLSFGESRLPALGGFLNPYGGAYRSNDVNYWKHNVSLPGLRAPVDIYYDERLVPHIYASSIADLYFAQGYVQAQHRLFQLDLTARAAEGRLSEVLGARTKNFDLIRRRIGGGEFATKVDSLWQQDPVAYQAVSRYSDGVNAYIDGLDPVDYPIEYKLLDFEPSHWSPRSTALVALNMAYTLNFSQDDLAATAIRDRFGLAAYDFLFPKRSPEDQPVIPTGTDFQATDTALLQEIRAQDGLLFQGLIGKTPIAPETGLEPSLEGIGSNNWVVGPQRSATGHALLANDPHLGLTLPSIWFEAELHAENLHVHGVNLPGVPGITIGFNQDCAWGVTNVGHDVLNWHEITFTDAERTRYAVENNQTATIQRRVERIQVRNEEDLIDTVLVTAYGPIVYTDSSDARAGLALNWLTLQRPSASAIRAFLGLNMASSVPDFIESAKQLEWPAQNIIFANQKGDIALRVSGTLPRDLAREGEFLMRTGDQSASGFLSPELNPIAINPPQHYLTSANQISTDASYPYPYRGGFDHHRSRRINQLLAGTERATVEQMQAYQLDDYSVLAADMLPTLLRLTNREQLSATARGMLDIIERWNFEYDAEQFAPVIFERWLKSLRRATWDEFEALSSRPEAYMQPDDWRLAILLRDEPLSSWFDKQSTPAKENATDIVTTALETITNTLDSLSQLERYTWADENHPSVMHLARIPAFSRTDLRIGGRAGTLNAQKGDVGPSWRMVVDLQDNPQASVVYPGGQSGRPGHPHYDDFIDVWAKGEYFQVSMKSRAEVEGESRFQKVSLKP